MNKELVGVNPKRIFEYAIFFEIPVTLYSNESDWRLIVNIKELFEDKFTIATQQGFEHSITKERLDGKRILGVMRYKGMALNFQTLLSGNLIEDKEKDCNIISFQLPHEFFFTEKRKLTRTPLQTTKIDIKAHLEIIRDSHKLIYQTLELLNITRETVTFIFRKEGDDLLVGDLVQTVQLFNNGKMILDSQGTIQEINPFMEVSGTSTMCVIRLGHANSHQKSQNTQTGDDRRVSDRRIALPKNNVGFVEFIHPIFTDRRLFGEIDDISTSGISFFLKKSNFPIPPGMLLSDFQIQLPGSLRHQAKLKVIKSTEILNQKEDLVKIGGELTDFSIEFLKDVSTLISKDSVPNLSEATLENCEDLWEFFFESEFIYGSKQRQTKYNAKNILNTSRRLLSSNNPIAKIVLYKDAEEIKGHISTVRFYDSSWIIQHLSAKATKESILAGKALIDSMSAFYRNAKANDLLGSRYIVFYYRPNNIYPSTVFDGVKRLIGSKEICDSRDLRFCLLNGEQSKIFHVSQHSLTHSQAREANEDDLIILRNIVSDQKYRFLVESEDLKIGKFTSLKVSKEFEKLKLYRYRRIFTISNGKDLQIFGVCNYSSAGINLSELTNSFRIFSTNQSNTEYSTLLDELITLIIDSYKKTDVPYPVLLLEKDQVLPSRYIDDKIYTHWYLDIRHVKKFKEATDFVFENIKSFVRSQKRIIQSGSSSTRKIGKSAESNYKFGT